MPFKGAAPYGTQREADSPLILNDPPDVRIAVNGNHIAYLIVNGPVTVRNRESIEQVVRTLGSRGQTIVTILIRDDAAIIETNTADMDFREGIEVQPLSPGVVQIRIPSGGITTDMLTDAMVTAIKLADNSVTTSKIANLNVTGAKIADKTITAGKIADDTITALQIAPNAIGASELADGAVDLAAMASNSVDSSKIVDGSIGTAELANLAVTAAKIAAKTITAAQIADSTITTTQILDNTITGNDIATNAVGPVELNASQIFYTFVDNSINTTAQTSATTVFNQTNSITLPIGSYLCIGLAKINAEGISAPADGYVTAHRVTTEIANGGGVQRWEQGVDTTHVALFVHSFTLAAATATYFRTLWTASTGTLGPKQAEIVVLCIRTA